MPEIAEQVVEQNQNIIENNQSSIIERQIIESARNFDIKGTCERYFHYFDFENEGSQTRNNSRGEKLDNAFVNDFNTARKLSDCLRPHLVNNYGFGDLNFKSFEIRSGSEDNIYTIDKTGKAHSCYGINKKTEFNSDVKEVSIKYARDIKTAPKYFMNNVPYDCKEMFEVTKESKQGEPLKITLWMYQINGKQFIVYDGYFSKRRKSEKNENYSKIRA